MLRSFPRLFSNLFKMLDVCIFLSAFVLAFALADDFPSDYSTYLDKLKYSKAFIIGYLISWIYLSAEWKIYYSKRIASFYKEIIAVIKASMISSAIGYFISEIASSQPDNEYIFLTFCVLNIILLFSFRLSLRKFLRFVRSKGFNYRNIVIVGKNERSAALANRILDEEEFGLKIIGYVDDSCRSSVKTRFPESVSHLGGLEELRVLLNSHIVDELFIFLPIKSFYQKIKDIIEVCAERGVVVRIAADLFSFRKSSNLLERDDSLELLTIVSGLDDPYKTFVKRCIDILVSLVVMILLMPIFLIICFLIKVDSPGPVFFIQERVGCNNRRFKLYKFRTMIMDADRRKSDLAHMNEMDGPVFKIKNDPRITWVGKYLRTWSLDEFPQLLNVLRGEMSLVGPRPPLAEEVEKYSWVQRRRLSVKPGVTGLWQVNGRNTIAFDEWVRMDLEYIDNWTLSLDLQILLKTVLVVLSRKGAM